MGTIDATAYFDENEFRRRRENLRESMRTRGFDALLVSNPENIYYLTGLDHMGYFAPQFLLFALNSEPLLITRAMEWAVVKDQVPRLLHKGYSDSSEPSATQSRQEPAQADSVRSIPLRAGAGRPSRSPSAAVQATVEAIEEMELAQSTIALDTMSSFLPYAVADGIMSGVPGASWAPIGDTIDDVRLVQTEKELALTRRAARITDAMLLSGVAAAGEGIHLKEIVGSVYYASFRQGGTYPGFVPLVRTRGNLLHEHGTWGDVQLANGELLFLEMSGCVGRYHAPAGRLVNIESDGPQTERVNAVCQEAQLAAADEIRHGAIAGDVYEAWQTVLNRAGLEKYRRHHCGYTVGIGYPPSWSGGGVPVGLRRGSDMRLRSGMVFHLMSWLLGSDMGSAFLSDTIIVREDRCEFLTTVDRNVIMR